MADHVSVAFRRLNVFVTFVFVIFVVKIIVAMTQISIHHRTGNTYDVTVADGKGTSGHEVTVWPSDLARYAPDATPEALIEASFRFLLEREPKEAILKRFELPVIERYFPEYAAMVGGMIDDQ